MPFTLFRSALFGLALFSLSACSVPDYVHYTPIESEQELQPLLDYYSSQPKESADRMGSGLSPGDVVAVIDTPQGYMTAKLYLQGNPSIAGNFAQLAARGSYDGLIFHRVIPDFMIQGGDPLGTGVGGQAATGGKIPDEFNDLYSNVRGSLSMANAGPNTNGSQFFINQADNTFLDHDKEPLSSKHAVFGEVIVGMEVLDALSLVPTEPGDRPVEDVTMEVDLYMIPVDGASTIEEAVQTLTSQ